MLLHLRPAPTDWLSAVQPKAFSRVAGGSALWQIFLLPFQIQWDYLLGSQCGPKVTRQGENHICFGLSSKSPPPPRRYGVRGAYRQDCPVAVGAGHTLQTRALTQRLPQFMRTACGEGAGKVPPPPSPGHIRVAGAFYSCPRADLTGKGDPSS